MNRKTSKKKCKVLTIRLVDTEHSYLKHLSFDRNMTLSQFVLEAVRDYIRRKT